MIADSMILELDAGNTRIKWRLLSADPAQVRRGSCSDAQALLAVLSAENLLGQVERVRLASVRSVPDTSTLIAQLEAALHCGVGLAQVSAEAAGVRNAYSDVSTMGVDRWLGILAAYNRHRGACCIVSCGTAITIDYVDGTGIHKGGYILPGLSLQRRSLLAATSIKLAQEESWPAERVSIDIGRSTRDAVDHGILAVAVNGLVAMLRRGDLLYITGGDAAVVAAALQKKGVSHRLDHDIILDGLAHALP